MKYTVLYAPTATGYSAHVPDLPGCIGAAATLRRAKSCKRDAIFRASHPRLLVGCRGPSKPVHYRERYPNGADQLSADDDGIATWRRDDAIKGQQCKADSACADPFLKALGRAAESCRCPRFVDRNVDRGELLLFVFSKADEIIGWGRTNAIPQDAG